MKFKWTETEDVYWSCVVVIAIVVMVEMRPKDHEEVKFKTTEYTQHDFKRLTRCSSLNENLRDDLYVSQEANVQILKRWIL